jgi:hypothetical protein
MGDGVIIFCHRPHLRSEHRPRRNAGLPGGRSLSLSTATRVPARRRRLATTLFQLVLKVLYIYTEQRVVGEISKVVRNTEHHNGDVLLDGRNEELISQLR